MHKKRACGFSIIEILVVVTLIGLLVAIAIPSVNSLLGLELGKSANKVQGLIKDAYTRAALSNQVQRIIYDLDTDSIWVEESASKVRLEKGEDEYLPGKSSAASKKSIFKPADDDLGEAWKLSSPVKIKSVWVEHLREPAKSGKVAQYFFPGGTAEAAHITLVEENDEQGLTVVVEPLTGDSFIEDTEVPIPQN